MEKNRKKRIKRGFDIASYVLLALVFGLLVFKFIRVYAYNDTTLFGYNFYNVLSESMDPTFKKGTVIVDKKYDSYENLDIGTIITFRDSKLSGYPNTHRIVGYQYQYLQNGKYVSDKIICYDHGEYKNDIKTAYDFYKKYDSKLFEIIGYITQGDNANATIDSEPRLYESIIGIYKKNMSVLTVFYKLFKSNFGFIFLIMVPLLSLLVLQIISMAKAKSIEDNEKKIEDNQKEIDDITERLKKEAIEEYLRKQEENNKD